MYPLAGGLYLGWALGANDAANVFGTAVASRIISFRKACLLCAAMVIIGAALQGERGIQTLSGLTVQTGATLAVVSVSAAIVVTLMTFLKLPISTSQAIVGSIIGVGLARHDVCWGGLGKVVACWVATPLGAMVLAVLIYKALSLCFRIVPMSMLTRDKLLWGGLLLVGAYGSYALGANNVANATGIFSGQIPGLSDDLLALIGGGAIALGVITFSRRVMLAVGSNVMRLDAFSAFVTVASMAVTVHVFAIIGVPVSTSQGIVGALVGVGFVRGIHAVNFRVVRNISFGWFLTPAVALVLSSAGYAIFCQAGQ